MGKTLIIKDADFHENGFKGYFYSPLYQGYITSNPNSEHFGVMVVNDPESPIVPNVIMTKVLIKHNSSILIAIEDNNIIIDDLNITYVASAENADILLNNTLTNIVASVYPWSNKERQSDGRFIFSNNTNNDLYYYINFGYSNTGPALSVNNKKCYSESIKIL